ncbi:MAG: hypothetical protein O3A00_08035 [Planctomycetota bacterium]|nr:hypothetical protein [Planctomycetota bacterium]
MYRNRLCKHLSFIFVGVALCNISVAESLKVRGFDVDASPPVGSPLAYDPTKEVSTPLSCRGIVLLGSGRPIVLVAVDWLGIANDANKVFREVLAKAAGTTPDRVAVHALHQHDAPRCDFSSDQMLADLQINKLSYDTGFARDVFRRAAKAVTAAVQDAEPVTHLGLGVGIVEKVASNRRILGEDGKVKHTRYTATRDPVVRAFPTGTIDPQLKMISLWNGDRPLAVLSYYATHPQSYYRTGQANPDFPGMARNMQQQEISTLVVHFNGAGGNIGAGKWNDGSRANRQVLADRVAAGMKLAWKSTKRVPISAEDVGWDSIPVRLPPGAHLKDPKLLAVLKDEKAAQLTRMGAAKHLVFLRRCESGDTIDIGCLRIGRARILHMPGELFVEYQLAAQQLRPDLFVAMAAYGDYGPGYIGTEIAYGQGGYETSDRASRVSPKVEAVLMDAIKKLIAPTK